MARLFLTHTILLVALLGLAVPGAVHAKAKEAPKEEKADGHAAPAGEHGAAAGEGATLSLEEHVPSIQNERTYSAAELEVLGSLEERRIMLDRRTQALELREKLVDMLEERLAGRVSELNALKADLEKIMGSASGEDEGKLKQLASVYASMKPDAAAQVLNRVDNLLVHDILVRMPAKKAAKLMEALEPVKARRLSELMAQKTPLPAVPEVSATAAP